MKKNRRFFSYVGILLFLLLSSCSTPASRVNAAEKDVATANKELEEANKKLQLEMESYRKATLEKIAANEQKINAFNDRMDKLKSKEKEEYNKRMNELNSKNSDLRMRLETYKEEGKENWENFKTKFNQDMDSLQARIVNF